MKNKKNKFFFVENGTKVSSDLGIFSYDDYKVNPLCKDIFQFFNRNSDFQFKKDFFDIIFFFNDRLEIMVWLDSEEYDIPRNVADYSNKPYPIMFIQFEVKKTLNGSDIDTLEAIRKEFEKDIYYLHEDKYVDQDYLKTFITEN